MKVSLIQMNSVADKAVNVASAVRLIERAVDEEGPDWIALPECFDFLGGARAEKFAAAEPFPDGPAYRAMQELAARRKVFIHAGSILERPEFGERIHNTTVVFDRSGGEIARYRKIHMFDVTTPDGARYHESSAFAPGDRVVTYRCGDMTVGCAICYDLRFPALFQELALRGADMIALPAAFTLQTGKDHWETLCRARAIETQCFFCAPAQIGAHMAGGERRLTYGHSLVADPWGHVIAKASDGVGLVTARLDPALIGRVRAQIPVASHRTAFAPG
ncbi:carbon-nitrogen hydrolase family protein [Methylocella sp.]|uniref:carbon-nitrogen hydrolase family protein n=1 Tax=Methylocella sp. TaxID=1978226 RepID=UPI003784D235